jgi:hypothetical protein
MKAKRHWTYCETRVEPHEAKQWAAAAKALDMSLARLIRTSVRQRLAAEPRPSQEVTS